MEPPDPIPNSAVKRVIADGSVGSPHARVGHRQAPITKAPRISAGEPFSFHRDLEFNCPGINNPCAPRDFVYVHIARFFALIESAVISPLEACLNATLDEFGNIVARMRLDPLLGEAMRLSAQACTHCLASGGRILLAGNGGSAAQAQHVACELVGRFAVERRGLAAIALGTDAAVTTALGNDLGFEQVFARQVEALGRTGDVLVVFSTSGNSPNILRALETAGAAGVSRIAFGGGDGGAMAGMCDVLVLVPSSITPRIQEAHLLLGHVLCENIEARLFAATGYAHD